MTQPTPRFTGIFIPIEILQRTDINAFDKIVLAWIDALYCPQHRGCFASNEYLATQLGVEANTIAKILTKFRKTNLIEDVSFDGRTRVIRALVNKYVEEVQRNAALDNYPTPIGQPSNPAFPNCPSYPYIDSKDDRKDIMSEPAVGLNKYFFEKLSIINPKLRPPDSKKAEEEFDKMLRIDKRSEKEIKEIIDFIVYDHQNPTSDKFTWSMAIQSPFKLRKHFASVWLQMNKKTPQQASNEAVEASMNLIKENKVYAEKIYKKIESKMLPGKPIMRIDPRFVFISYDERKLNYLLEYTMKNFKDILINSLKKVELL